MNVIDLDAYSCTFNFESHFCEASADVAQVPCTARFDFSNAFPTLNHGWLFLVLECLGFPSDLLALIRVMYSDVQAFSSGLGNGDFLFDVQCGVIAGALANSILFLLAINPIVDFSII